MENVKLLGASALIFLLVGYGVGRYVQPAKEVVKTEVVQHEVTKKQIVTVVKEVTKPDGTKESTTTTTDNSIENKESKASSLSSKPTEKQWLFGVGANPLAYYQTYSIKVDRRVLGPFFLGGQYTRDRSENIGLVNVTMEF